MSLGLDADAYAATLNPPSPPAELTSAELDMIRKLGLDAQAYSAAKNQPPPPEGLSAEDMEMIRRLGIDPQAYADAKASQGVEHETPNPARADRFGVSSGLHFARGSGKAGNTGNSFANTQKP